MGAASVVPMSGLTQITVDGGGTSLGSVPSQAGSRWVLRVELEPAAIRTLGRSPSRYAQTDTKGDEWAG